MRASTYRFAFALVLAALAGTAAAQTTADQMRASAQKLRSTVESLGPNLPADARAAMLKQAEELEASARDATFNTAGTPMPKPTEAERIIAERGALDWLKREAACAGYTEENYLTFRYNPAINDRDSHCRNAYGHWATYLRVSRNGGDAEAASQALYYYDAAARRAVGSHSGR